MISRIVDSSVRFPLIITVFISCPLERNVMTLIPRAGRVVTAYTIRGGIGTEICLWRCSVRILVVVIGSSWIILHSFPVGGSDIDASWSVGGYSFFFGRCPLKLLLYVRQLDPYGFRKYCLTSSSDRIPALFTVFLREIVSSIECSGLFILFFNRRKKSSPFSFRKVLNLWSWWPSPQIFSRHLIRWENL